jgi:hypothetical protein
MSDIFGHLDDLMIEIVPDTVFMLIGKPSDRQVLKEKYERGMVLAS